jgi:hypothetical protein
MANIFNYNPDEIICVIAGITTIEGFVDGTFINVTKDVMPFSSKRTADGQVSRVYNNDQTYTIQITLHRGSPSNDILTKLWLVDELTQMGKFPLLLKDPTGSDLFFSATSWIESIPALAQSTTVDERVWTIRSSSAVINIGSNQEPSSLIEDIINAATGALPAIEGLL